MNISAPTCKHKLQPQPPYYFRCYVCEELFVVMPISVLEELGIDLLQIKTMEKSWRGELQANKERQEKEI